ncbi:MAG: Wzt carbohydrate-binding domain-containing protein, partial [Nitrospinae bacterium]|nr:Wzt carbohydrate-binding domain-containing protein [Nitrospinota bacterium]
IAFGSQQGHIESVECLRDGEKTKFYNKEELITIKIVSEVDETVKNPKMLFILQDTKKYNIYGIRSDETIQWEFSENNRKKATMYFQFKASLVPGEYSVTLALQDYKSANITTLIERQTHAVDFVIVSKGLEEIYGVVDLKATCSNSIVNKQEA